MCLTDNQKNLFDKWIKRHDISCPVCGSKQIEHAEPIMIKRYSIDLKAWPGDPIEYPILRLFCPTCAYVLHFNARPILNLPHEGAQFVRP